MGYLGILPTSAATSGKVVKTASVSGSYTIDATTGQYWILTVTANSTVTINFGSNTGDAFDILVQFVLGSSKTITFSGILWNAGAAPAVGGTGTHVVRFTQNSAGQVFGEVVGLTFS